MTNPNRLLGFPGSKHKLGKVDNFDGGSDNLDMNERMARVESDIEHIKSDVHDIRSDLREMRGDVNNLRLWIAGAVLAILAVMIAFGQWQASWFQHSLDRNWEISNKALEAVQSRQGQDQPIVIQLPAQQSNQTTPSP